MMKSKINWNDKEEVRKYWKKYKKQYYWKHKEEIKTYNKKYREANKEKIKTYYKKNKKIIQAYIKNYNQKHKKERKEYLKKWHKNNREKEKARSKKYNEKHKEKIKKQVKKYNQEHKEEKKIYDHKRRARVKGNGGYYTIKEIEKLRKESKGICKGYNKEPHYVGEENLEIDHIIPISKGGTSNIDNIQLLCKSCNCSKGTN